MSLDVIYFNMIFEEHKAVSSFWNSVGSLVSQKVSIIVGVSLLLV